MKYVRLGDRGPRVSRLGFGCMRLPMTDAGKVDRALAIPMLHRALERGVTYFDTAVGYCRGDSQAVLGEAMEGRRDRVFLSTKNGLHDAPADAWRAKLDESLRLLRTDRLDLYNFHGLRWDTYRRHLRGRSGKLALMRRAQREGLVRHIGCSFHDTPANLVRLAKTGAFEVMTVSYNLLHRELADAIAEVHALGIGIVAMNPVGGGRLGVDSAQIRRAVRAGVRSTPEAALRFVLAHPGVDVVLSGMSTRAQLEENVRIVAAERPLTARQIAAMDATLARAREREGVPCPACGYCLPCPHGVEIPTVFGAYNDFRTYGLLEPARRGYDEIAGGAARCANCGVCLARCPHGIAIPAELNRAAAALDRRFDGAGATLALRGAAGRGALRADLLLRNLGAAPLCPAPSLELDGGARAAAPAAAPGEVAPLGTSVHRGWRIRLPPGAARLCGRIVLDDGTPARRECSVDQPFLLAPRGAWRVHRLRAPARPGRRAGLGMDLALRREGDTLRVRADVHAPAGAGLGKPARLELHLDARPSAERRADCSDGVERFVFALDRCAVQTRTGAACRLGLRRAGRPRGARLEFGLPLRRIAPGGAAPGARLAADVLLAVAGPDGREAGRLTLGGARSPHPNPLAWPPLLLG